MRTLFADGLRALAYIIIRTADRVAPQHNPDPVGTFCTGVVEVQHDPPWIIKGERDDGFTSTPVT